VRASCSNIPPAGSRPPPVQRFPASRSPVRCRWPRAATRPARALLSGQLPGGEPSPLPGRFLALMRGMPHTEVVKLIDGQAYRYSRLSLPGYDRILDLYVILYAGSNPTALACYASKEFSSYLSQCEQIVARLTPIGQSSTYDLTPNTAYARRLGAVIDGLNGQRLKLRREMRIQATPAAVSGLATTLADRFAAAAASLAVARIAAGGRFHANRAGELDRARPRRVQDPCRRVHRQRSGWLRRRTSAGRHGGGRCGHCARGLCPAWVQPELAPTGQSPKGPAQRTGRRTGRVTGANTPGLVDGCEMSVE